MCFRIQDFCPILERRWSAYIRNDISLCGEHLMLKDIDISGA